MKVKCSISLTPEQKKFAEEEADKRGQSLTTYIQSFIIKEMGKPREV